MKEGISTSPVEWANYKIKHDEHLYYKAALLNAIPLVNDKGEEILVQINSKEFRDLITHLIQQGRFIEAKDLFELSKKASQEEIEKELYTITPLSVRLGYPYYVKVMLKALKEKTSASAVLRRLIVEEVNNLMKELANDPKTNKRLLDGIKRQAEKLVSAIKEKEREQYLFDWEFDEVNTTLWKYLDEVAYDASMAWLQRKGLNPEIFKLAMPERSRYAPFLLISGGIYYKPETEQFVLDISMGMALILEPEWDYYLYEYPVLVLEQFDPEEILKFHQITGLPGFKGLSVSEIRELKEKVKEISRDDLVKIVFEGEGDDFFEYYSYAPEDLTNYMDKWNDFLSKLLSIEIPIEISQSDVVIAGTSIPLTDPKKVSKYIFDIYKERFGIKDLSSMNIALDKLTLEEAEKTLRMLAFREATLRISEFVAKLIAESLPSSDVIKTSVPRAFPKLLETFRGKKLRKILEDKIGGMAV